MRQDTQQAEEQQIRLTSDELSELLDTAIARHGEVQRREDEQALHGAVNSVEDALEIARSLNIPEEHVHAALQEMQKRKVRERNRQAVQSGRKSLVAALGIFAAVLSLGGLLVKGPLALLFFAAAIGLVLFAVLKARAPVSDAEADRTEALPIAGTCRVCGAPAYTPRATFCEEHRFKGPNAG